MQIPRVALYTTDCSILDQPGFQQGSISQPESTTTRCTNMLLFMALSTLLYILLPALIATGVTASESPVNLASHDVKRLSTPLKNLLHRRDTIIIPGSPNAPDGFSLNSTSGKVAETEAFEEDISIPRFGSDTYFLVC